MIQLELTVDGQTHAVEMKEEDGQWIATVDGISFPVRVDRRGMQAAATAGATLHDIHLIDRHTASIDGRPTRFAIHALTGVEGAASDAAGAYGPIRPPMIGRIENVLVSAGDTVARGDVLFVLEAMKMRNEVKAAADGVVKAVHAAAGDAVEPTTTILELAAE